MPFVETQDETLPDIFQIPPQYAPEQGFGEAFTSSFPANLRQTNSVVSAFSVLHGANAPEPGYDAFSDIQGYEDHARNFIGAQSRADVAGIKAQIDREAQDKESIRAAGWAGMAGAMAAGALDPLLLLPIGGSLKLGDSLLTAGLATARAGALGLTAQESVLQASQATRPVSESVTNVAVGTLLAGILGTVVGPGIGARVVKDFEIPKAADPLQSGSIRITPEELATDTQTPKPSSKRDLVVARKMLDGSIKYGELGQIHADLLTEEELKDYATDMSTEDQMGFAEKKNAPFMTRPEASAWIRENQPDREIGSRGLEAANYSSEAAEKAKVGGSAAAGGETVLRRADLTQGKDAQGYDIVDMKGAGDTLRQKAKETLDSGGKVTLFTGGKEVSIVSVDSMMRDAQGQPWGAMSVLAPKSGEDDRLVLQAAKSEEFSTAKAGGGAAAGGAQATARTEAKLKSAFGAENVLRQTSPGLRLATSGDVETRRAAQQLLETPFTYEENALGIAPEPAVETLVKMHQAPLAQALQNLDELYVQYRTGAAGGRLARLKLQATDLVNKTNALSFGEFRAEVGRTMRRNDEHEIPEVASAAKAMRETIFDPLKDGAIRVGLLPKDISIETAASYLSRVWNTKKIIAQRNDFSERIVTWLKAGQRGAARETDEASQKFASLEPQELSDIADQIIRTLVGTPGGRIHYDPIPLKKYGVLKERTFNIPDRMVEDYLEDDVSFLARRYVHTMAPDVELAKRFKTADMAEQIAKIEDSYDVKSKALPDGSPQRTVLDGQRQADIRDILAMRDRLRGTYAAPEDPNSFGTRAVQVIKNWNFLRLMGGMTVSSLSDLARPVMTEGLGRVMSAGLVPMIRNLKAVRLSMNEVKLSGTGLDMVSGSRAHALADLGDDFGQHSKFERGLQAATQMFGTLSLMNPWNAAVKQFNGVLVQHRIFTDTAKVAEGTASARAVEQLGASRIDTNMALRIAKQYARWGEDVDGTKLANTHLWTDEYALEAFRAAIVRDVDRSIVTPGISDSPLVASRLLGSPEIGQLAFQFRSFTFASMQKVLIAGLQDRDAATLNGLVLSVALGAMTYYIKTLQAGKIPSDDPLTWLSEGVDRSGVTSSLFDINNIVEKATRGQIGINAFRSGPQMTRYASRNALDALLGPTAGTAEDFLRMTGTLATGDFSEANKRAMLRLVPAQNLFYLRSLLDAAAADDNPR